MKVTQINWQQHTGRESRKETLANPGSPLELMMLHEGVKEVKITKFSGDSVTYIKLEDDDPPYVDEDGDMPDLTDEEHDALVEASQERIRLRQEEKAEYEELQG